MSSELTIDIQLTELGFSSWDFQVLKQKDTQHASDLDYALSSSSPTSSSSSSAATSLLLSSSSSAAAAATSSLCSMPVKIVVDEVTNVGHFSPVVSSKPSSSDNTNSRLNPSVDHVDSTHTSTGESRRAPCKKNTGLVGEKRKRYRRSDTNADDLKLKQNKKKNKYKYQRKKDKKLTLMSMDFSRDDCEEEDEQNVDDGDIDLTEEEECDALSSDSNGSEEHRCQVCNLTFSTAFLLQEHLHIHSGERLYRCAECDKQFCHLVNYRKHLRSHAQASMIQCIICTAPFTTQEELQQHLETNHFEDKFYQCDLCKRIFTSMAECKRHVQSHKQRLRRYPCHKCEQSFRYHSSLLYHLKRHNKGMFVCTDCGLAFSTKAVLLRHSFHHLGLLPYTCVRCKRHYRLSSHYMKHECKPEQLQCVACLVIFQSQEDFQKHKKNTGCWGHQTALTAKTNDIRCMECGQVFSSSEELKKHAGTHQRVMKCSECGMGFRSSIMLMSHMGGHAAKRPCLCKDCGLGFCHQQAYDSHIKTCGLVTPVPIATKKLKSDSNKKEASSTPIIKEILPAPQPVKVHATSEESGQAKPAEDLMTFPLDKKPVSPAPMVMFLPVPSTSATASIQNPQKLNSEVSKQVLSTPQAIHCPEKERTVLEGSCTTNEQVANIESKPVMHILYLDAKMDQKKNVLTDLEILNILNKIKKNDQKKGSLTVAESATENS